MEKYLIIFGGALVLLAFYSRGARAGVYDKELDDFYVPPDTAPDYARLLIDESLDVERNPYDDNGDGISDGYYQYDEDGNAQWEGYSDFSTEVFGGGEWAVDEYGDVYLTQPVYDPGLFHPINYTPDKGERQPPGSWGDISMPKPKNAQTYSGNAVSTLKVEEGFSATPYRDAGGWSIGYGHYMGREPDRQSVTQAEAETLLLADMNDALALVRLNDRGMRLTQNQLDALVMITYNVGPKLYRNRDGSRTGIWKALQAHNAPAVAQEMARWNKSQNAQGQTVVNPVLDARRGRDISLFMSINV